MSELLGPPAADFPNHLLAPLPRDATHPVREAPAGGPESRFVERNSFRYSSSSSARPSPDKRNEFRSTESGPARDRAHGSHLGLLAALVLACLVPRSLVASKLDVLCNDGVVYIQLAEALERGDIAGGLGGMGLNTYPPILVLAHRAGLDWETAGKVWGVLIASLAVCPLFGFLRRMYDTRVAFAGATIYACHPKLIEWSPELLRDSTFWFLFLFSLYSTWRAVTQIRLRWYLAAGVGTALALHTRFEGWFLYVPVIWWTVLRARAVPTGRPRLAAGLLLLLATCPLLVTAVNLTWLGDQPHWELGRFNRLEYVALWWQSLFDKQAPGDASASHAAANRASLSPAEPGAFAASSSSFIPHPSSVQAAPSSVHAAPVSPQRQAPRMSVGKMLWEFANTVRRGMDAVFGLLWLAGFWAWRHVWLRRDHYPLFAAALLILAGMWVHLWYAQESSSRYVLTIVLIAMPGAALGLVALCDRLARLPQLAVSASLPASVARCRAWLLIACLLGGWGLGRSCFNDYAGRQREAALGRWLLAERGPGRPIATSGRMLLLGHYSRSDAEMLPTGDVEEALRLLSSCRAEFTVFSRRAVEPRMLRRLMDASAQLGYRPVSAGRLPPGHDWNDLVVLERREGGGA